MRQLILAKLSTNEVSLMWYSDYGNQFQTAAMVTKKPSSWCGAMLGDSGWFWGTPEDSARLGGEALIQKKLKRCCRMLCNSSARVWWWQRAVRRQRGYLAARQLSQRVLPNAFLHKDAVKMFQWAWPASSDFARSRPHHWIRKLLKWCLTIKWPSYAITRHYLTTKMGLLSSAMAIYKSKL